MLKIAANPGLLRANIFLDMLTALGVTVLGAVLFVTLRKQNKKIALTALGLYILEVALLAEGLSTQPRGGLRWSLGGATKGKRRFAKLPAA
jgi:hypothetical protein